jgi:hypothetical protein
MVTNNDLDNHSEYCDCYQCNESHFDAYYPIDGEVVNVNKTFSGITPSGKKITVNEGSFLSPNVVKVISTSVKNNTMTINDGVTPELITVKPYDKYLFSKANAINQKLFSSASVTTKAVKNVATGVLDVAQGGIETIGFLGKNLKYVLILLVIVVVIGALYKAKALTQ